MDNTAGCQFYLSKDALGASITTAKSSEVNILVPASGPDGDWVCFHVYSILMYLFDIFEDFIVCSSLGLKVILECKLVV